MCNGSSRVPPVVNAGYAARRMCLRMFSGAMNNMPAMNSQSGRGLLCHSRATGPPGYRHGARRSGTATLLREIKISGWLVGWLVPPVRGMVKIWLTPASRYPVPARVCVRKIGEYPGPSQHFRPSAMVVDASFFVRAAHNCGDNNKRHGAGNVGADGTTEPPFSRVHFSTKSLKLRTPCGLISKPSR